MKNLNNRGFGLVETLIVSVFVMGIISLVFVNFYPLIGEYEKREVYDDVDGKYAAYWMKTLFEDNLPDDFAITNNYYVMDCDHLFGNKNTCKHLKENFNIINMYITNFNITNFKTTVKSNNAFSSNLKEYVNYLPNYSKQSGKSKYRIILEMKRTKDGNDYNAYSTMEVNIKWKN